jgi:diadenylate cyclase
MAKAPASSRRSESKESWVLAKHAFEIALQFAREGRKGGSIDRHMFRHIGCVRPGGSHVSADPESVRGTPKRDRNIQNASFLETLRELTAIDGAIIVNAKGIVELAGTYLDAPRRKAKMKPGLGARHAAAAAITAVANTVAVVVSQPSGHVIVFADGRSVLELEKSS